MGGKFKFSNYVLEIATLIINSQIKSLKSKIYIRYTMTTISTKYKFDQDFCSLNILYTHLKKIIRNMLFLKQQLAENHFVEKEINNLCTDAKIFKLIGPILVQQDQNDVIRNLNKRIKLIITDLDQLEADKKKLEQRILGKKEVDKAQL